MSQHGDSLRSLRGLLFNPVRPAVLAAALTLLPALARAQAIEAWVQRYNGEANNNDWPSAIAVDGSNNVVVTGASTGSDYYDDYVTIKYSGAGVPLWTNRYNGPGNQQDQAHAVAVDGSGNVYVTGGSYGGGNSVDYLTIKYSGAGVPLWTNRYNGPANGADWAMAVAVDSSTNVVVTGGLIGCATVKYSSAGALLWARTYSMDRVNALAVDGSNNVIVTGYSGSGGGQDYVTIKYSSAGVLLWTNTYNGLGNFTDWAEAVAVDGNNNVIVTGYSARTNQWPYNHDYTTIMYSSAGLPLWTNRYNGPGNGNGEANAVAVDLSGNVVVTGGDNGGDYATIKYSNAGVPLWTNRYNGPGNNPDAARAVAVNARGYVYVTGDSVGSGTGADYATVVYSSAGAALWTNRYSGSGNYYDRPSALALDASGNVYVAGGSKDAIGRYSDFATVKYVVPPIIARQPLSRSNAVGTAASFTVEAAGGLPLSYQWRRQGTNLLDGGNISGVTTTNLLLANVQLADAAGYSVVITNAYGSVTSSVAQLTVYVASNPGRFTNLSYSPETGFSFIFRDGTFGRPYRIQVSPSLTGGWLDWQSFNYLGPVGFSDLGAVEVTNRFYRAVSP